MNLRNILDQMQVTLLLNNVIRENKNYATEHTDNNHDFFFFFFINPACTGVNFHEPNPSSKPHGATPLVFIEFFLLTCSAHYFFDGIFFPFDHVRFAVCCYVSTDRFC